MMVVLSKLITNKNKKHIAHCSPKQNKFETFTSFFLFFVFLVLLPHALKTMLHDCIIPASNFSVPVFHHLPQRLQSTLLQLMLHFRHRIPTAELLTFTRELRATIGSAPVDDNDDTWPGVYFRMLSAHCQMCVSKGGLIFETSD